MKNIFSKFSSLALVAMMTLGMFSAATPAFAGSQESGWNTAYYDCPTLSVVNVTTNEGMNTNQYNCWTAQSVTANRVGDVINITLFFHNSTGATVSDVGTVITEGNLSGPNAVRFAGNIYAGGRLVASDLVQVNIPANTKLTYVKSIVGFPKSSGRNRDLGSSRAIFSGLGVGPLQSTDEDQGYVKLKYVLESTGSTTTGNTPTVNTQNPNISGNNVTFNGDVNAGNLATDAWFEYYTDSRCSVSATTVGQRHVGTSNGSYSHPITLNSGTYSYRAFARNSNGTGAASQCISFTIGSGSSTSNLSVTTYAPSSLNNNNGSVTLNGYYDVNASGTLYFEIWRDNGGYNATPVVRSTAAGTGNYSLDLSGLADGTYRYRAYFVSTNGNEVRGTNQTFVINRNTNTCSNGATNYPTCTFTQNVTAPTAQTLSPVSYSARQATLGGYYTMGNTSGSTWFEYGTTDALGSRTSSISRAVAAAGNTSQTIYGLNPNTTYYYRVVSQNAQGNIVYGEIRSFTTPAASIIDNITRVIAPSRTVRTVVATPAVSTSTVTTTDATFVGGTGVKYLRLDINNDQDDISRGETVTYEVQWENISTDVTLKDLVLEVTLPKELRISDSSRGDIDQSANAVYVNIDQLDPREDGRMTVTARVNGSLSAGAPVVGRAILAFKNPTLDGAQENAIAYDSDRFIANSNVLGASAFGAGFLPGTLAGWLIIALIIILIILAARHYMRAGYYDDRDHGGPYTPYRPQA